MPLQSATYTVADIELTVAYQSLRDGTFKVICNDETHSVAIHQAGEGTIDLALGGQRLQFDIQRNGMQWLVHGDNGNLVLTESPRYPDASGVDAGGGLTAPMPGAVLTTEVAAGDTVAKGDLLVILEAMKMEHRIVASSDGTVTSIHFNAGDQVAQGATLLDLE